MNKSLGERPFRLALNPNSATHGLPKLDKTEPIDHQMLLRPFRSRDSSWLSPALSRVRKQTQQPTLCFVSSVEPEIREKSSRQGASSRRQVPQDRFEKTLTLKRSSRGVSRAAFVPGIKQQEEKAHSPCYTLCKDTKLGL